MTAMADLGLVTDARGLLVELGRRFGVAGPPAPPEDGRREVPAGPTGPSGRGPARA